MLSIYPELFLNSLMYTPSVLTETNKKNVLQFLHLAKFFATNAKLAIKEFNKKNIKIFDPLVRDRCCQIHALQIIEIFEDKSIQSEVQTLAATIEKVLKVINQRTNKIPTINNANSFGQFVEDLKLSVEVSRQVMLLLQAYILTMATTTNQPRQIDHKTLQIKLSKSLKIETIKQIVKMARSAFSESSSKFIQTVASKLIHISEEDLNLLRARLAIVRNIDIDKIPLTTTCMFYNMQAVLLNASEKQFLLLVKEFRTDKTKSKGVFFRSEYPGGPFVTVSKELQDSDKPVLVFKSELALEVTSDQLAEYVQRTTIQEIVLAFITDIDQFVTDNDVSSLDSQAQEEISLYTEKAKLYSTQIIKRIVHAYPSTVKYEEVV